jgi:hypothetical protein
MTEPSNQMILDAIGELQKTLQMLVDLLTEEDDGDPNASLDDPPSGEQQAEIDGL